VLFSNACFAIVAASSMQYGPTFGSDKMITKAGAYSAQKRSQNKFYLFLRKKRPYSHKKSSHKGFLFFESGCF
jgi:hypothetical protein